MQSRSDGRGRGGSAQVAGDFGFRALGRRLGVDSVFGFERKAVWHRARKRKYDALVQQLTYEGATVEAVSRELREFEDDLGEKYPRFGSIENSKGP